MCYVLLVIQLLRMNGFFLSVMDFFPVCHGLHRAVVPWQSGRSATWDVTVAYTLATSYVSQNALQTGSAAAAASARKKTKYSTLSASRHVFPVAVETLGPLSDEAHSLIAEIGRRAMLCTADQRETTYFSGNSAFQCSFRVPFRTYIFTFANFKTVEMKYQFTKI